MKSLLVCAMLVSVCCSEAFGALPVFRTVRNLNDTGANSLRQLVMDSSPGDKIIFHSALNGGTITLTSKEIVLDKNLNIIGPGASLLAVRGSQNPPQTNSRL